MSWTDERIAARLTELDPVRGTGAGTPTAADWAQLRRITEPAARSGVFWPRQLWAIPAAAFAVVITIGVVAITAPPEPAFADTPPPLLVSALSESAPEFLDESIRILDAAPSTTARREGQLVHWQYGQGTEDAPVIVPARYVWERDATGRGSLVVTAEESYSVRTDGSIVPPAGPAPAPGSPVDASPSAAYLGAFPSLPPADPEGLARDLQRAVSLDPSSDATEYWGAFQVLMNEWTVTPAHHASMLRILEREGGSELLGKVTDRLGREGVALRLPESGARPFEVTIIVDEVTRRIIASDVIYSGGNDLLDEPIGSVIEYSAWISRAR